MCVNMIIKQPLSLHEKGKQNTKKMDQSLNLILISKKHIYVDFCFEIEFCKCNSD